MNKVKLTTKTSLLVTLLAVSTIGLAACQSNTNANGDVKYTTTKEAKVDRAMDNQPESPYWFPKDLLKWDFNKDADAKYNVATVPLAKRVSKKDLPKSNKTQDPNMKVVALSIMNSSTSGNAPHGISTFDANVFSNWQYIDKLVYWGGSAGEGIIVPPSADVIDASHKNGVPVLGTIFFPQTVSGGKVEWLDQFLKKDSAGNFPMIDKLIEVSNKLGFDGWFINQETDTVVTSFDDVKEDLEKVKANNQKEEKLNQKRAKLMQEFIAQFKQKNQKLDIMWYDSMTADGQMDWQNALTDKNKAYLVDADMKPVADDMFLNFWWSEDKLADKDLLKASREKAKENKIDPYDLYAGIDVQENGYATPTKWNLFTDKNNVPYTSLGLYAPNWTYSSSETPDDFVTKEQGFWVNSFDDPRKSVATRDTSWPGISTYAVEQTAITKLPFVSNFNVGNGYNYFIKGKKVSNLDWNNRSLQDVMPTYRWIFDHEGDNTLGVTYDYADAYNGGNSLLLRGNMEKAKKSTMKLYAVDFKLNKETQFETVAKASNKTDLNLVLGLKDGSSKVIKADKQVGNKWTTVTYDLKAVANKEITSISYAINSDQTNSEYELRLGRLSILNKTKKADMSVSDLKIEGKLFDEDEANFSGVRLAWQSKGDASYYEIYRVNQDKSYSFIAATPATNHYINGLERNDDTNKTNLVVVPVDIAGNRGKASDQAVLKWPNNKVPKASFTVSKTLVAPGEKVQFKNTSSANTKDVKWEFEGANVKTSTSKKPEVSFKKPGTYTVKLTASNKDGKKTVVEKNYITVQKGAPAKLESLTKGAKADASGFTNDSEAPALAIDDKLDTKWCATGNPPHTLTIDLGKVKSVAEVDLAHAQEGGENPDMNTRAYTIEVSKDGKDFKKVARTSNNTASKSANKFAVQKVRYVRLVVDKPTQSADTAVRIYDMKILGLN